MNEQLKIIISAEVDKLKKGVSDAKAEVSNFKNEVSKSKEDLSKAWDSIGGAATKASKVIITGVAAAGTALLALGASTKDYRAEQGKLNSAFESAGSSADTAKQVYNDLYRVLGESDTSVEAANHLAQMTTNQKELSQWTTICQGVYATFGDSLPIEGLTESANETAKVGQVTGSLADALNWAGISEDDFNQKLAACNSEAEREKLIRETLSKTYDDAAAKYEKNAANVLAQNEAHAKLEATMAQLGDAVAPVVTAFTSFANDALAAVVPYIQQMAEQYMPVLKDVLAGIAEKLGSVAEFIANHLPLVATIAGIILGIAAAYQVASAAMSIYTTVKTIHTAVTTVATAAQTAFAAANFAALAPILLVIAAITAIIAVIVVCIKHWDKIKETVGKVWGKIKEFTSEAVGKVKDKFNEMKEGISDKVSAIKDKVSEKFSQVKEVMGKAIDAAKKNQEEKLVAMKAAYEKHGGGIKGAAAAMMEGVKQNFSTAFSAIDKLTGGKLSDVVGKFKDKMGDAKKAVHNAIEKIKKKFDFKWKLPDLKLPHISVSGSFSLKPPSVPKFSIKWNALGGVFDAPTLFGYGNSLQGLGEDGAEAVVPLEKNTKWLDKIAEKLSEKQGSTPIILQVDGKVFAETAISTINQRTRQTGRLQLVLA